MMAAGAEKSGPTTAVGFVWTLCVAAFCCALVVAGVSTLLLCVVPLAHPLLWIPFFFVAWAVALIHALLFGVPVALALHGWAGAGYRSMALAGAVVGAFPMWLLGLPIASAMFFSIFGAIGGVAFHRAVLGQRMQHAQAIAHEAAWSMDRRQAPATRVYYNSACPVCRSGIGLQKGAMGACDVEWIDVHAHPEAADELGVDLETVRERLYVRDAEGVKIGADAAAALWSRTRGLRWLARLLARPRMHAVAQRAYDAFARWLYRWNRRNGRW